MTKQRIPDASKTIAPCPVCGTMPKLMPPALANLRTFKDYLKVDCECVIRTLGQLVSLSDWTKGVNATLGRTLRYSYGIHTMSELESRLAEYPKAPSGFTMLPTKAERWQR